MDDFQILIGGPAGHGIMSAGEVLGKAFVKNGAYVFLSNNYPSLIRGGHNIIKLRVSDNYISSSNKKIDFLIALDKRTCDIHNNDLSENAVILTKKGYCDDKRCIYIPDKLTEDKYINLPLISLLYFLFFDNIEILRKSIEKRYKNKNIKVNLKKIKKFAESFIFKFNVSTKEKKYAFLSGNHTIALGALQAGMNYAAIYPMTPINAMLSYLRDRVDVFQPEDEIAGINSAIGASFAGKRAMVATSGGGFCLMTEGLGLSAMTETPLVIVEGQRTGPATGMPTRTEQGDLLFMINASHGEFPRVVFTPGSAKEAYLFTIKAFYLAEKYQLPVIILVDKYLSESYYSVNLKKFKEEKITRQSITKNIITNYKRYKKTKNGISPRSLPGTKRGEHNCNSDEHDEYGFSTENSSVRKDMVNKRMSKFTELLKEIPKPTVLNNDSKIMLVCWGSSKGLVKEIALKLNVGFLHFNTLHPFDRTIKHVLKNKKIIIIENNKTSQLYKLLRQEIMIKVDKTINKYDGDQFTQDTLFDEIKKIKDKL